MFSLHNEYINNVSICFLVLVSENLTKAMRERYIRYTFPVKYARNAAIEVTFEEMFVDLRLQMFEDSKQLPEEMTYRDVEKMLKAKRSSKSIDYKQLLEVLDDKVAPHSVLIIGIPGVGKTTFVKQMAKQWAKRKLWTQVRYLFVITLRDLPQDTKMTLEELLFDQLCAQSLTDEERRVAMDEIHASQEHTVLFLEGADELPSFEYTTKYERRCGQKADMNTLITSLIKPDAMLPGAKVVITTRPIDQLTSKVCSRVTELYGFSEVDIYTYVHKFSGGDSDLEQSILSYLATNTNIATFCYIPVTCNFVCMCLQDMQRGDMASVTTMTQLYVYAIMHLIRKLHPLLKDDPKVFDDKEVFSKVGPSLTSHAKVAKRCTMRSSLQLTLYDEDVKEISTEHRQSGFLDQSLTKDEVTPEKSRKCWSFTHLTIQEFFTAVALLMTGDDISQLTASRQSIRKQEVVLTFVVGLLCDRKNAKFMEYFLSVESKKAVSVFKPWTFLEKFMEYFRSNQINPRMFLKNLAAKTYPLQLVSLVHEAQRENLVDVVPAHIKAEHVFPTEMTSLAWAIQQQKCPVLKLE